MSDSNTPSISGDSVELLRTALATLDDIIFSLDRQLVVQTWQAPRSSGIYSQASDFVGRKLAEILPQELNSRFLEACEKAEHTGLEALEYSLEMMGRIHWYLARIAPLEQGQGWVVVIRNQTRLREYSHALEIRTKQLDSQFDNLPLATLVFIGFSGGLLFQRFNKAALRLIGEDLTTLVGRPIGELFYNNETFIDAGFRCLREKGAFSHELNLAWPGQEAGRLVTIDFVYAPPEIVMLHIMDIDSVRRTQYQAYLATFVIEAAIEGVVLTDPAGTIEQVNPAFTTITGYSPEEAIGKNPRILKSERHDEAFYQRLWHELLTTDRWEGEIWNRRKDGEIFPEKMIIAAIRDKNGLLRHFVSVFNDISDLKLRDERIAYQSMHDALTDLPNRNLLTDRVRSALGRLEKDQNAFLPLLFIDLDHFKMINDAHGHLVGDYLITQVARRLEALLPSGATLARVGGDDFIILLRSSEKTNELISFVSKILADFREPFLIGKDEFFMTPSIGIAVGPQDGSDEISLIKNSELAMYHAKKKGRNTWQFFSTDMNREATRRFDLQSSLRRAFDENQFEVWYQPIIDSRQGRVISAEALVRWREPERGLVSPGEFIPILEESDQIVALGNYVLDEAIRATRDWQGSLPDLALSVNIAARQFSEPDFILSVFRAIDKYQLDPGLVALEITENTIMSDRSRVASAMEQLKRMGFKISIDDFGTGYSSLSYLKRFEADYLKIDRSFVIDLPEDRESGAIAEAVIVLARSLGLTTIAEGVEHQEQVEFLRELGCQRIQGYFFSRPLPLDEFLAYARKFNQG